MTLSIVEQSPTASRWLGKVLLMLVASIPLVLILIPLLTFWLSTREEIAETHNLAIRYQRLAHLLPKLEQQVQQLKGAGVATDLFYGQNTSAALAQMQADIGRIMSGQGLILRTIQPLPVADAAPYEKLMVRVEGTLHHRQLVGLLTQLEQLRPSLLIENLNLQVPNTVGQSNNVAEVEVSFRMDFVGFRVKP